MGQVGYSKAVAACWIIVSLTACGDASSIATFTHDLGHNQRIIGRQQTLYSYASEPGASTRPAGMALPNDVNRRNWPKSDYNCLWRNADPARFRFKADTAPPAQVTLTCQFGTSDFPHWSPGTDPAKYATEASQRDHATFRIDWHRRGNGYEMDMLQVMVERHDVGRSFTSHWAGEEIKKLKIDQQDIRFPRSSTDVITFNVAASVPQHQFPGAVETVPTLAFTVAGNASPAPKWMFF